MEKGLLFTYLLTYGGAVVALIDPFLGLLIYVCFAIVRPDSMWYWSVPQGNYSRIVAIAMLIGWAMKGFGSWQLGRAKIVVFALVGFWIWAALGAVFAEHREAAWHFVEEFAKVVLPFLVGATMIDSTSKLRKLAWMVFLCEGFLAYQLNFDYLFDGFNRVHEMGFASLDNNGVAVGMVACAGMGFFLGLHEKNLYLKLLAFALTLLMGHVVLLSFSRGGMLALIVTGVTAFVLIPKQAKHMFVLALAILLAFRLAGKEVRERLETSFAEDTERDSSAQSRLDLWAGCWQQMLKRPVLGIGALNWNLSSDQFGFITDKSAHSTWFEVGVEMGFPGVGCLVLFYLSCMKRLWRFTRRSTLVADPWFPDAARMVIASITGFCVAAQFITVQGVEIPYYVTLVGAGVLKLGSTLPCSSTACALGTIPYQEVYESK